MVAPGANYAVTDADVDALGELLADADVLVLQLELPIPFVERAVALGAASGCAVVLNLAPAATVCASTLRNTQVLVVNETEARFLLGGGDDVERTTGQLLALGPRQVVVTLGAQGAVVNDAGVVSRIEAPAVQAVDTTGAGDAFVGALSVGLASGTPLAAAVQFAVTAASATVGTAGAQASHPVLASLIAD